MSRTFADERDWMNVGTQLCARAVDGLDDDALAGPSALPGWTRAHVIAHIDGNARALSNLVTWASTGVETPMYSSPTQRNADIEAGAALSAQELRARFAESTAALDAGLAGLTDAQWAAEVRTIQGRTIPASMIPWLRSREVMVHAYDLDGGVTFEDRPDSFLIAFIDDVVERRVTLEDHPAIALEADGLGWEIPGVGNTVEVTGTLPQVAAYVAGRGTLGPQLPAWL